MCAQPSEQRNPYRPGAGLVPTYLAGRDGILRRIDNTLRAAPELSANVKFTGLRGVGKTVLLKEVEHRASESLGWVATREQIEPRHNQEDDLTRLIENLSERAIQQSPRSARLRAKVGDVVGAAREWVSVSFEDFQFSLIGSSDRSADVARALYLAARAAHENGRNGYLLLLDEARILRDDKKRNGEHPLSTIIAAVNSLQEEGVPVARHVRTADTEDQSVECSNVLGTNVPRRRSCRAGRHRRRRGGVRQTFGGNRGDGTR